MWLSARLEKVLLPLLYTPLTLPGCDTLRLHRDSSTPANVFQFYLA